MIQAVAVSSTEELLACVDLPRLCTSSDARPLSGSAIDDPALPPASAHIGTERPALTRKAGPDADLTERQSPAALRERDQNWTKAAIDLSMKYPTASPEEPR